ncbi:MAG: phosphate signaling complex protein PhoU [Nitrospinota bacterium]|nr:phosphate signaling complex protein PhoU [Nitrospinota bacterium]
MKPHTSKNFETELNNLKDKVLRMGGMVEAAIGKAMRALEWRDAKLAQTVIEEDHLVNRFEVEIDEMCVGIVALRQPAAEDLRLIITGLKISTDLERIGDLAVNMSERVLELMDAPQSASQADLMRMAQIAQGMLHDSLDAYVDRDADKAEAVCKRDNVVDDINRQIFRALLNQMTGAPAGISGYLGLMNISRHMERIADHSTNIAEMVIYLVKGKDIRHTSFAK